MEAYISSVREIFAVPTAKMNVEEVTLRRRRALRRVDRELEKGNDKVALSLVKQLKAHPAGLLRGFGAVAVAPKVPRMDGLKFAGERKISSLQSVVDAAYYSIKRSLEFQLKEVDTEISPQGFGEMINEENQNSILEDHLMCAQHEAGHFLVGYLLGVFPMRYKVPSADDLIQDKFACGKVKFAGFEFLRNVGLDTIPNKKLSRGKLNNETLKKFSCVILGGLAAEHLVFGYSELLHSDVVKANYVVRQLDRVLKWLGFTENEADSLTRQAAEAAALILSCQSEAQSSLAKSMALGRSVGFCIEAIERTLII